MRLTCYAHLIHNLLSCMLDETEMKGIVEQSSKLSSYVKNAGLNSKLKTSLKRYTTTRWNSVYTMISAIIENYQPVYDLLVERQILRNESKLKQNKAPDNQITDLITVLNRTRLVEIRDFLQPFKVI